MRCNKIPLTRKGSFDLPTYRFGDGGFCRNAGPLEVCREVIGTCGDAATVFDACMRGLLGEELWVLPVDVGCRARMAVRVAVGTVDGVEASPSRILRAAAFSGCESFVLGHNHPTGDPTPSLADWTATSELLSACDRVGLELVDHVIVGDGVYVSMRARNEGLFLGERGLGS